MLSKSCATITAPCASNVSSLFRRSSLVAYNRHHRRRAVQLVCGPVRWSLEKHNHGVLANAAAGVLPRRPSQSLWRWALIAVVSALVALGVKWILQQMRRNGTPLPAILAGPQQARVQKPEEEKEYQMALARTRQAVFVQKAVQLMSAGNPSRAMVELERALHENEICRSAPIGLHEAKEMHGLYRLHLENAEMPPKYSVLLQLREMLVINEAEAEGIEAEIMGSVWDWGKVASVDLLSAHLAAYNAFQSKQG